MISTWYSFGEYRWRMSREQVFQLLDTLEE